MLSGFSSAAIALQATNSINVGVGAVSSVVRHPAVTAMEASTLAGAYPGRFTLGIGHGVPAWTKQMHLYPKSVLTAMRESVTSVKRLLNGETLTEMGQYFSFDEVKLTHPAPALQVLTAVVGPKSIDLTAEIADGIMVSVLGGPKYIKIVSERIESLRPDQKTSFRLVTYALTSVGKDGVSARKNIRPATAFYLNAMGPTLITEAYDANDTLSAIMNKGGQAALEEEIQDDWMNWLTVSGNPDECTQAINNLFSAGSTSVVLCIAPSEELPQQLELIAEEMLPNL